MEQQVREIVERMFTHVASFHGKDEGWVNNKAAVQGAKEQIINTTVREIVDEFEHLVGIRLQGDKKTYYTGKEVMEKTNEKRVD